MKSETEGLNTQMVNEGSGNTRGTAVTNEHDAREEAKLNTLNIKHKTVKIKKEIK